MKEYQKQQGKKAAAENKHIFEYFLKMFEMILPVKLYELYCYFKSIIEKKTGICRVNNV